uniref:Tetraspanin 1 n=1 Tax=Chelonoidis abingdonii TaxID=106734 RepID=A0A8C0IMI8_CHEAB
WKMGCFSFLKLMMFVFNGVIFLSGLAVLGIGIWVKVDGGSFVQILGAAAPQLMQLINVGYLCITVGTFLLLMGFLGCCGAMKESKCLLLTVSAHTRCRLGRSPGPRRRGARACRYDAPTGTAT